MHKKALALFLLLVVISLPAWAGQKNTDQYADKVKKYLYSAAQTGQGSQEIDLYEELSRDFEEDQKPVIYDPLEPWNRLMFKFNDKMYFYVLKPVSSVYAQTFPVTWRKGLKNAFYNIRYPGRLINNILQGRLKRSLQETGRFIINTSLGFAGLLRPADEIDMLKPPPAKKDTGLTLGTWGIGSGPYIVWPVLGPSSLRDSFGEIGDYFLDPLNYVEPGNLAWALKSEEKVNGLSLRLGEYEDLKQAALDPYTALKDAYVQYRNKQIRK